MKLLDYLSKQHSDDALLIWFFLLLGFIAALVTVGVTAFQIVKLAV